MKKVLYVVPLFVLCLQICYAPPVTQNKKENKTTNEEDSDINGLEDYMEYHRYLKEVVNALESDPAFRQKLEKADESEIKSGKIAEELEFVSHHVRTRLDEIKRLELERLKELMGKKIKLENPNSINEDPVHHHLDHTNPHTFEIEDLKKLIAKTTADLAEADRKRREQFKQYELDKEYKKQEKLNHTNGEEREKLEKQLKELEEKHKKHEKLHEPGHKAQLEEVWEEQDQMQQEFDPKTFFMLHDLDGNGLWDQDEVKSLFIKELDKMYQQGAPEDDMRERFEEMERMRESVFKEMDKNHDEFIDYNEFLQQTNSNEFKQDHGWKALDEQRPYTDEELAEYIRQHEAANQIYQQHPGAYQVPQGGYQQVPPGGYQQVPPGGYQQVPPGGYQQVPPGGYQQHPQAGYQHAPQVGYQQQVPPGAYQQMPQGGYQHQVVPPSGYQQAPPNGYNPQQAGAPQGQFHGGQVPHNPPQPLPGHISQNELNTNEIHAPQQQGYQQHVGQQSGQNQNINYQQQQAQPAQILNQQKQNIQDSIQQQQNQGHQQQNQGHQQQNQGHQQQNQGQINQQQQQANNIPQQQANQQQTGERVPENPNVQQISQNQAAPPV